MVNRGWVALLGLWVLSRLCLSQEPIVVRNGRALSLAFLRLAPRLDVLSKNEKRSEWRLLVANDVRNAFSGKGERVFEDDEVTRLEAILSKGLGNKTELSICLPFEAIGGGFLDPLIAEWHANVLKWNRREREGQPFGRSVIETPGNRTFGSAAGLGDVSMQLDHDWFGRTVSVAIKVPTGDPTKLLGSGGIDLGIGLGMPLW